MLKRLPNILCATMAPSACCITEPHTSAAMLTISVMGLGASHLIWGPDSIWFRSPQRQIEALRRREIPPALQKVRGFAALGSADGIIQSNILGRNAARLHNLQSTRTSQSDFLDQHPCSYREQGFQRSNRAYGYIQAL